MGTCVLCLVRLHRVRLRSGWSVFLFVFLGAKMVDVRDGGFYCKVILDSVAPCEKRLTTVEVRYPRFIHSEVLTHRDRARNSASSRAIPWPKMMAAIIDDPVIPIRFGSEQQGMQTGGEINDPEAARLVWLEARDNAVRSAQHLANLGVHKSICNRLTEPFMWITVVMTATEWNNFFRLRCHADAEVHFQKIAEMIRVARESSQPTPVKDGGWHLPYVSGVDHKALTPTPFSTLSLCKISAARCARVSYLTQDGQRDPMKDLELFDRLSNGSGFGHWCYDEKTEVLTDGGWRSWPDAYRDREHVLLAAVEPNARDVRFESPAGWVEKHYEGRMYSLSGQALDMLVTPNHRLVVASRLSGGSWTKFSAIPADEVFGHPVRHIRSGSLVDSQRVSSENPWGYSAREFASLVSFFCGDGNAESGGADSIYFNIHMHQKISFLRSISRSAVKLESGKWAVRGNGIAKWFRENCYTEDGQKRLPDNFLFSTGDEFLGLMDGFRNSDGSKKRNTWHYDTTSPVLAGQFQSLLHINGLASGWSVRKRSENNPRWRDCMRITVSDRTSPRVEPNQSRSRTYREEWAWYCGKIYCASVSTGCLLVRRNGLPYVSGNSPMEHVAQSLATPERSGPFIGWKQFRKEFPFENSVG